MLNFGKLQNRFTSKAIADGGRMVLVEVQDECDIIASKAAITSSLLAMTMEAIPDVEKLIGQSEIYTCELS